MSSIVFVIIGIAFLMAGCFGDGQIFPRSRRGYFRAGRTSEALPISRRTGKAICFVIGSGFTLGGAIGVANRSPWSTMKRAA